MTIFGKSGKLKYTAVKNPDEPDTVDLEPMKQRCFTPACFWSSLFTSVLIGTYYIPSIGLTFYQRWFLQVKLSAMLTFIFLITTHFSEFSLSTDYSYSPYVCKICFGIVYTNCLYEAKTRIPKGQ